MPQPLTTPPAPARPGSARPARGPSAAEATAGAPAGLSATERRRIVVGERVRFARDLHDLVGPRMSAVILQCELADRLLDGRPDTAHDQLAEALRGMRQILDDVRTVAHGYHCLSLETEIESARTLLESAGVRTETDFPRAALPAPLQTVLATVVREATANVLKHSDARSCALLIRVGPESVRLTVTNDGVPAAGGATAPSPSPGIGLRSLAERVAAVGGLLTHGADGPGHHTLDARFPLKAAPAPGGGPRPADVVGGADPVRPT
ncbi:sensor histidine kinase [Streptomyces sp. NPDC001834]|uniref:sensor histidine kinase n=1 Tax=unclassified Streptomyces TaxID=2593676 RepID=UPI003446B32F